MRKLIIAVMSALVLLGGLLVTTTVAQDAPQVEITAVHTSNTPVEVGQDVHIGVTYTVVGTQTVTTTQPSPYIIDVDIINDENMTVASCYEPLNGILGLSGGQDNTYTCTAIVTSAGNFTVSAEILSNPNAITPTKSISDTAGLTATTPLTTGLSTLSRSTNNPTLVVEDNDSVLSNGVIQLFAGLAVFSAVMLIVAVGAETVIDSIKVAFGLKRKVTSLEALNQLQALLPGKLEELGVDTASQKQVTKLIDEMTAVVKPTLQFPDLTTAIADGDINKLVETLQSIAPDAIVIQTFAKDIQHFVHAASDKFEALKEPLVQMLSSIIIDLQNVQNNKAVEKTLPSLSLNTVINDLTGIETKLQAIQVDSDDIGKTLKEVYALMAEIGKIIDSFLDKLKSWGSKQTADWLRKKRDVLLQESNQTVLDDFATDVKPLLHAFSFLDPNLESEGQATVNQFLVKIDGIVKTSTDTYLRSVDNLLQGVEIRRFQTQSPLRKLWRRLREAGAMYGLLAIWLVFALGFALIGQLIRPFLTCAPTATTSLSCILKSDPAILGISGGLSIIFIIITAIAGRFIYHMKHVMPVHMQQQQLTPNPQPPEPEAAVKSAEDGAEDTVSATNNTDDQTTAAGDDATPSTPPPAPTPIAQPTPSMRQQLLPWLHWLFGKPQAPTILSYIEIFWNWLHGKTDLDPAKYGTPPTLDRMVARTIGNREDVDPASMALTAENLAQVVLLRTNQQEDEEKTRKRLMRILAMFVGALLAYLLQIDAAVLLDKALPGTSGLVNGLFVLQGSFLHKHWAFLPATLNITPGIVLTGLAASAGSAFWHDQLERLQAAKQVTKSAAQVLQQAQGALSSLDERQ